MLNRMLFEAPVFPLCLVTTALLGIGCASEDPDDARAFNGDPTISAGDAATVNCNEEWAADAATLEQRVFELVNEVRAQGATCGGQQMPAQAPLSLNVVLTCASRAHSKDMATRDFFDHTNPDGEDPFDRLQAAGYDFRGAAENIALGQRSAEQVIESWIDSEGHCRNIMGNYVDVGVGYYLSGERPYWTQNFGVRR